MSETEIGLGEETSAGRSPTFIDTIPVWGRIGLLSFGGPAAQIALMHRMIVDERRWLSERQFLNALSFCMLLPGPEAMQLATYAGWRLHGTAGGLVAGLLFVLPGAAVILALSTVYALYGATPMLQTVFTSVKAAVLVIVLEALLRVARRSLTERRHWAIAGASFVALFLLALPFPLVVFAAACYGLAAGRPAAEHTGGVALAVPVRHTARRIAFWLAAWLLPIALVGLLSGHSVLGEIGVFFSKLATVTFGGAYAVLAYMAQDAVQSKNWLSAAEMMDGLGLAETTPGPLILVTQFVGFLAAGRAGGGFDLGLAVAGAAVSLWATFAPCFLWVFVGAPYIEWITAKRRLRSALSAISAAVVGVILNLSLWFALHVLFASIETRHWYGLVLWWPDLGSIDLVALALAFVAGISLLVLHKSVLTTLAVCAALGALIEILS